MTDFIFDGELLSDHGCAVVFFDNGELSWSGGDIEFTTLRSPDSDKQTFYASAYNNPLVVTLSVGKDPCNVTEQSDMYFTQEEQMDLLGWLCREDGYHWLQFNEEEYEDVYYNGYFTYEPVRKAGHIVGFNLTFTTDSPYGYSKLFTHEFTLDQSNDTFTFINYSSKLGVIKPKVTITPSSNGILSFQTGIVGNMVTTEIVSVIANKDIVLDEENDMLDGFNPIDFNGWKFPIIARSHKDNISRFMLNNNSVSAKFKIEYRYVKKVVV